MRINTWYISSLLVSIVVSIPILTVFSSFFEDTSNYFEILKSTFLYEYIINSFILLFGVLIFTLIIGVGCAYIVSFYNFPGVKFFKWALILSFAVPAYIYAYSLTAFFENFGTLYSIIKSILGPGEYNKLIPKFDSIIIVGAMANNILKYKGLKIGNSVYEKNIDYIIQEIFTYAEKNKCKIYFPKDVKIGKKLKDKSLEKDFKDIEDDDMILDVGSKTLVEIKKIIDDSSTILWNGPLGYFENENFSFGSLEVAKYIANRGNKIFSVVGGGDTVAVINSLNMKDKFNFVSTAGGAFLEYLEGKVLPGIKALN